MSDYALLEEVREEAQGSTLAAAALVGDTQLLVDYSGDFDDEGGTLDLNGARLAYAGVVDGDLPDDPDAIILAVPLTVAADADDTVSVVSGGQILTDLIAHVTMGEGDQVLIRLTVDQRNQWPVGVYTDPVLVVVSDDLLHIEDAPGRTPPGRVAFWNSDLAVATADDTAVPIGLSFAPISGSMHVRQNGADLAPSEWTIDGLLVTVPPSDGVVIRADDVFTTAYSYDDGAAVHVTTAITPTFRDTAPQNLNGFIIPTGAHVGDLLIAVAMMPDTESVTALNGFALVGQSAFVTHAAVGAGTRTYRLEVYAAVNDGSSVPTVSNVAAQDVVCAMSAFADGHDVGATFATVADATSASAPPLDPVSLRVWGTIGNAISISPSRGTVVLSTNYIEIDIAMSIDADPTAAPATATGTAGWCLASLAVTP